MNKRLAFVMFACLLAGFGMTASVTAQSKDSTDVDTLNQLQEDLGVAMVAVDIDQIDRIYADDWATVNSSGQIYTKQNLLDDIKSGKHRLSWFRIGPVDVQVFGDVAMVQGSVAEKRTDAGKDTSGEFVYMDLMRKRAGKWVIVRSQSARVK